jgi:ubiquinone/menaquinone biosynthesis C-methylase UbiE
MRAFLRQFGHPEGLLGWFAGHVMALKNGERSRWALGVLAPSEGEHILEIGFGPGVDVARLVRAVGRSGQASGVDISREMVRQARARNRAAVRAGRVHLKQGSAARLPHDDATFDAVYAVNSAQFWPDLTQGMREVRRVLRPGGRALILVQPRSRGATDGDARAFGDRLVAAMNAAGFASTQTREVHLAPVLAVAALGVR